MLVRTLWAVLVMTSRAAFVTAFWAVFVTALIAMATDPFVVMAVSPTAGFLSVVSPMAMSSMAVLETAFAALEAMHSGQCQLHSSCSCRCPVCWGCRFGWQRSARHRPC